MIIQSPESQMPEPYKTYVRQRSETIVSVLSSFITDTNIQLCPRAITADEIIFPEPESIMYGAVVKNPSDGFKSVLYEPIFGQNMDDGIATNSKDLALNYATKQFVRGNRVRVKDPCESDGQGQHLVTTPEEVKEKLDELNSTHEFGAVLMPHLDVITQRVSVGMINLKDYGTYYYIGQESAITHDSSQVYGGTELGLFHNANQEGLATAAQKLDVSESLVNLGLDSLAKYRALCHEVGRASVDVIEGVTDNGTIHRSVVDLTPRVGGTTPAEVLAIREVQQAPELTCFASSRLLYEPSCSPKFGVNFIDTDSLVINAQVHEVTR